MGLQQWGGPANPVLQAGVRSASAMRRKAAGVAPRRSAPASGRVRIDTPLKRPGNRSIRGTRAPWNGSSRHRRPSGGPRRGVRRKGVSLNQSCSIAGCDAIMWPPGSRSHTDQKRRISRDVPSDTRMCFSKSDTGPAIEHIVVLEMRHDLRGREAGVHHDEVRLRVDHPQHSRICLIQELLAVVGVSLHARAHVLRVLERRDGRLRGRNIDAVGKLSAPEQTSGVRSTDGVPDP